MRGLILLAIVALLAAPAGAAASEARMTSGTLPGSQRIVIVGGAGESNAIAIGTQGFDFVVEDRISPITAGTGCVQVTASKVACRAADPMMPPDLVANLGDGNDALGFSSPSISLGLTVRLNGEAGNDAMAAPAFTSAAVALVGEDGDDRLTGGEGSADQLFGDAGNDQLNSANGDADDQVYCGEGTDAVTADFDDAIEGDCEQKSLIGSPTAKPKVCKVPKLKGRKLGAARKAIRRANCTVGKVIRRYSAKVARGRVISQRPRAGTRRAAGRPVGVVVSRGPRIRR